MLALADGCMAQLSLSAETCVAPALSNESVLLHAETISGTVLILRALSLSVRASRSPAESLRSRSYFPLMPSQVVSPDLKPVTIHYA